MRIIPIQTTAPIRYDPTLQIRNPRLSDQIINANRVVNIFVLFNMECLSIEAPGIWEVLC